jgi:hypothetical protein
MNDEILIGLGEVSEETKGCIGGQFETATTPDLKKPIDPTECP